MTAFLHLAWALAPRFVHYLARDHETRRSDSPARVEAGKRPHRHLRLARRWERADDGALVAHWVPGGADTVSPSTGRCDRMLMGNIPDALIDDAYHDERRGSVLALIAVSRLARLNSVRGRTEAPDAEAGPPK